MRKLRKQTSIYCAHSKVELCPLTALSNFYYKNPQDSTDKTGR